MNAKFFAAIGAVALSAAVAHADVQSANVVGYQQVSVASGWSFKTITFKDVAGGNMSLNAIKCLKPDGSQWGTKGANRCAGDIRIQKIDEKGNYLTKYSYWSTLGDDEEVMGWCVGTDGETRATNVSFENGEGMIIECDKEDGLILQFSGEVTLSEGRLIPAGFSFSGNYTPVKVNLKTVRVLKADGVTEWGTKGANRCAGDIRIQKIDEKGNYLTKYSYWSTLGDDEEVMGWCVGTDGETRATDVEFEPGEGFIAECDKEDGVTIVMPNPLNK